ncbi:hypothetical protein FQN52_005330 [Onygenales sp. PD_12]|nr:hypothetical protein FQN52_005330 [Onygenales sp. PD_12]
MVAREQNPLDPEEDPSSSLLEEIDSEGKPLDKDHLMGAEQTPEQPIPHPAAAEEFVRLYTPYSGFARMAIHQVMISGQEVLATEPITLTNAAANRDPDRFEDPERFKFFSTI